MSAVAWKKAKKGGLGLFRNKRDDESETVEEEDEDEDVLSLFSYVTSMFSTPPQTDANSEVD